MYLIPLRIIKGHLPSDELLNRFPVLKDLYIPFISAIKTGDLAAYDRALDNAEHKLLELNLWLTLEKARELCMRSLFRRACVFSLYSPPLVTNDARDFLDGLPPTKALEYRSQCFTFL